MLVRIRAIFEANMRHELRQMQCRSNRVNIPRSRASLGRSPVTRRPLGGQEA